MHSRYTFSEGLRDGVPIGLAYLSVSFTIGLMAVNQGLTALLATIISATNVTSAGEVAGLRVIAAMGSVAEMALTQLVINARYALMGIALSQKLDDGFTVPKRLIAAFGITDEIFVVASCKKECVGAKYMYGLIAVPFLGWTLGTLLGGLAGDVFPADVKLALGIAIYGMFISIVLPPARKSRGIALCVALSAALRCVLFYVPALSRVSDGFAVILCAVISSAVMAAVCPKEEAA